MNNIPDEKLDSMLRAYCQRETKTYTYHKPNKLRFTAIAAACLVLVIMAGVIFVPHLFPANAGSGFIIVANAQTLDEAGTASGDEITTDNQVILENVSRNYITYDFDEILYEDAYGYDVAKKYLFHSFSTNLNINVVGEDIKSITYDFNKGAFNAVISPIEYSDDVKKDNFLFTYSHCLPRYTFNCKENEIIILCFNPVYNPDATYKLSRMYYSSPDDIVRCYHTFLPTTNYVYSESYEELVSTYGWAQDLCFGYRSSDPSVVTDEEKATLKAYAEADDMISFFNYQNQIFKRLVDGTEIDITVTYNSGDYETKTLVLTYNPIEVTDIEWYTDNPANFITGNISAILK